MKDPNQDPTNFAYCLTDVDGKGYADTLDSIFRDPKFTAKMESRNKLYSGLARMNQGQLNNALAQIKKMDQSLAYIVLQALVMRSLQVNHQETFSLNDLLSRVDLSDEKMKKANERLATNLDSVTFLADVLEAKMVDIKTDLDTLFGDVEFKQFDGVMAALRQMDAFFHQTRDKGTDEEQELFCEYADSIDNYIKKRMSTYIKKYRAMHEKNSDKKK